VCSVCKCRLKEGGYIMRRGKEGALLAIALQAVRVSIDPALSSTNTHSHVHVFSRIACVTAKTAAQSETYCSANMPFSHTWRFLCAQPYQKLLIRLQAQACCTIAACPMTGSPQVSCHTETFLNIML